MSLALIITTLIAAPDPGVPAPAVDLPRGVESARWEPLYVEQCKERLIEAGEPQRYRFSQRNRVQKRTRYKWDKLPIYCHVPQGTIWTTGPTGIRYYGFTMFNCSMALAMTRFEQIAQQEAKRVFALDHDAPIRAINHMGTYNCRRLRKKPEKQSQHSFGNAIDIGSFYIRGVGKVDIKAHWEARLPYLKPRSDFLKGLVARLQEEQVFTNVLDPTWDAAHANHLHIDLAELSDGLPSPALARTKAMPTGPREAAVMSVAPVGAQ